MPGTRSRLAATIPLPPMTADQAVLLFEILGEVAAAVWDAYDAEICALAQHELQRELAESCEDDLVDAGDPDADPSIPF